MFEITTKSYLDSGNAFVDTDDDHDIIKNEFKPDPAPSHSDIKVDPFVKLKEESIKKE